MDAVRMFVNGEAMVGGIIHHNLEGATFLGHVKTADKYRFYSVRDEFPGLHPTSALGVCIPGELYEVDYRVLRDRLLPSEPLELELTLIELEDGSGSLSMRMRDEEIRSNGVIDISDRGGWRLYRGGKQ